MTSIETGQSWSERLNPRNWTLTVKLVVVGLVPALLAFSLGILRVADQAAAAGEIGRSSQLLEVQERVAGTADSLRQERDEATLYVAGGRAGNRGVLEIGFSQSEAEVEEMLSALQGTDDLDATTLSAMQQAEGQIGQLPNLRTDSTDNPGIGTGQIASRYTEVVNSLDVLDRALLRQLRTPGIGRPGGRAHRCHQRGGAARRAAHAAGRRHPRRRTAAGRRRLGRGHRQRPPGGVR